MGAQVNFLKRREPTTRRDGTNEYEIRCKIGEGIEVKNEGENPEIWSYS